MKKVIIVIAIIGCLMVITGLTGCATGKSESDKAFDARVNRLLLDMGIEDSEAAETITIIH